MNKITTKLLWAKAAGKCSICKKDLISNGVISGEEAHIIAKSQDGPRGKAGLSQKILNNYANLILLCPNDHTLIDKYSSEWTEERLHKVKKEHEAWVEANFSQEALLEIAGKFNLAFSDVEVVTGLHVIKPTRFKPGTEINVDVRNAKQATGVKIGGD